MNKWYSLTKQPGPLTDNEVYRLLHPEPSFWESVDSDYWCDWFKFLFWPVIIVLLLIWIF